MYKHNLKSITKHHENFWTRDHIISLLWTLILSTVALVIQNAADNYVGSLNGVHVEDVILSNIPTFNLDIFIVQGALLMTFITMLLFVFKPKYILFSVKAIAVFIIIRSFFISLTHLGVDPHQLVFNVDNFGYELYNYLFNSSGDFFFSGHTGLPLLMSFIFWKEKRWRNFFLVVSCIMGISVLLAHVHYSIDVFAAPFMAYGIFIISRKLFVNDYKLLFRNTHSL